MSIGNKNKSDLNLYCQKAHLPTASYTSALVDGNFVSKVCVNGNEFTSTSGYAAKKEAENDAAGVALIAILQKEFGGKTIEEALAVLEQKYPKSKKKSKQASSSEASETQVHKDVNSTGVLTYANSVKSGNSATQHGVVATQSPQQRTSVASSMAQNYQGQIHSHPQSAVAAPTQTQAGVTMVLNQAVSHQQRQAMVRPPHTGSVQQREMVDQRPQVQQGVDRPSQAYVTSYSQQTMQLGQVDPVGTTIALSQGDTSVANRGGDLPEQVQRTPGQLSAISASFHPASHSLGPQQAPPTQVYAPPTAPYHGVQYPSNTVVYGQYAYGVPNPHMQSNYMHEAPPTCGHQWSHLHPHLINSPPLGVYPPSPTTAAVVPGIRVAPPPGMRSIHVAARFPGAQAALPQQLPHPQITPPPPPGLSAHQSASSPPQMTQNSHPLNAVPVKRLTGQASTCSNIQEDMIDSAKDTSKSTEFISHTKRLEEFCEAQHLPAPCYKVNEEKGKYFAEVRIGDRCYRTQWPCELFDQAKSTAAMEAIASLAVSMSSLSTSGTGNRQPSNSSSSSATTTSRNSSSITPSTQTTKGQSSTPTHPLSKQQQTLSLEQQQITSPGNTANPPPSALQPPSFFTNNSPSPPTATTTATTATSTQVQPKQVKPEQPPKTKNMASVNYKQILNIHCQKNRLPVNYECSASEDSVGYIAIVKIPGNTFESSPHGTKRAAEAEAAERAVRALGLAGMSQDGEHYHKARSDYGQHSRGGHVQQTSSASQAQSVGMVSYKNLLQEHMQKQGLTLPHYETERVDLGFKSTVRVHRLGNDSVEFTSGPQPVKKAAEQEAAKAACLELKLVH